jgi:hypothetical protein
MGALYVKKDLLDFRRKVATFENGKIYINNSKVGSYDNGKIYILEDGLFSPSKKVGSYENGRIYAINEKSVLNNEKLVAKLEDGKIYSKGFFFINGGKVATYDGDEAGAAAAYLVTVYLNELNKEDNKINDDEELQYW